MPQVLFPFFLFRMGLKDLVVNFAEIQANLEAIAIKVSTGIFFFTKWKNIHIEM